MMGATTQQELKKYKDLLGANTYNQQQTGQRGPSHMATRPCSANPRVNRSLNPLPQKLLLQAVLAVSPCAVGVTEDGLQDSGV